MHDAFAVGVIEGGGHLSSGARDISDRESPAQQPPRECFSFEILHHDELHALVFADIVERANARMGQPRDRPRLSCESGAPSHGACDVVRENLDRDRSAQSRIGGAVDIAHSTCPDPGNDFVRSQPCASGEGHQDSSVGLILASTRQWHCGVSSLAVALQLTLRRPRPAYADAAAPAALTSENPTRRPRSPSKYRQLKGSHDEFSPGPPV